MYDVLERSPQGQRCSRPNVLVHKVQAFVVVDDTEAELDHKVDAPSRTWWSSKLTPELSKDVTRSSQIRSFTILSDSLGKGARRVRHAGIDGSLHQPAAENLRRHNDAEAENHKVDAASRMCWPSKLIPEVSKDVPKRSKTSLSPSQQICQTLISSNSDNGMSSVHLHRSFESTTSWSYPSRPGPSLQPHLRSTPRVAKRHSHQGLRRRR